MKNKNLIIAAAAVFLIATSCLVSYENFRTFNPIKSGIGFAKIVIFDEDYAEINDFPRVIITNSENSKEIFMEIIENEGYEYVEQLGSAHFIEKDGERESVNSNINKYIGRWSWNR